MTVIYFNMMTVINATMITVIAEVESAQFPNVNLNDDSYHINIDNCHLVRKC